LNIIFFGSPSYSSNVLGYLVSSKHSVKAVVTQDIKTTKKKKDVKTPVGIFSEQCNIQTYYPNNLSDPKFLQTLKNFESDIFIIYAYGKILPKELIGVPKYGVINIHCSLLPKWRGAAPIQRALLNNDKTTGITFFRIDENLDTGKIISTYEYEISDSDDSLSLQESLTALAVKNIEDVFEKVILDSNFISQDDSVATYAKKLSKAESYINWDEDAEIIISKIKAFAGWPGVEAEIFGVRFKIIKAKYHKDVSSESNGKVLNFNHDQFEVKAKNGVIQIDKLQLPGKNIITCRDFYNSNSVFSMKIKNDSVK